MKHTETEVLTKNFYGAANTYNGFYSLFENLFSPDKYRKIFIIKGGPGCGKSTAMKKISEYAVNKGYEVENYYCSSSPTSLDGVIIPKLSTVILDGTPPHAVDPKYPAIRENIIDFGKAWDTTKAHKFDLQIRLLNNYKSDAYKRAYAYLSSCMSAKEVKRNCLQSYILEDKLNSAVKRICSKFKLKKSDGVINNVFTDCISGKGNVHQDTFENFSETKFFIKDYAGTSSVFFTHLVEILSDCKVNMTLALNPLNPEEYCGLWLPDEKISFTIYDDSFALNLDKKQIPYKIINTYRFCDYDAFKRNKIIYKYADKSQTTMMNGATKQLELAAKYHDEIEGLYYNFTDYNIITEMTNNLIKNIF